MKYLYIRKEIDSKVMEEFLSFLNENEGDDITILLRCPGGSCEVSRVMLHIINSDPKRFTIIGSNLHSVSFWIFYNAKCKRKLVEGSIGMYHFGRVQMEMTDDKKPYYGEDQIILKNSFDYYKPHSLQMANAVMTKKEMITFKKGEDVYFTFQRLKEIFADVEVI